MSSRMIIVLLTCLVVFTPFLFFLPFNLPPKFSVRLADTNRCVWVDDESLIDTAFNITLHAVNRGHRERCYLHGEAVVRYSGFALAWGRTRAFCVAAWDAKDVRVVVRNDGVGLPGSLRERMVADRRRVELEVDLRLFRGDDGSARPTWMSCKVTTARVAAPPDLMNPCAVFARQNWASDVAIY
ncbi:hypothetical protein QOZ80_1BG0080880 [Eleusine coracana subsp. coracana]|nr:hypothetical protein QOZ80_1BG0080880 [Eleusine coracana subsp. coracana]